MEMRDGGDLNETAICARSANPGRVAGEKARKTTRRRVKRVESGTEGGEGGRR
jgi:hypothetical protein